MKDQLVAKVSFRNFNFYDNFEFGFPDKQNEPKYWGWPQPDYPHNPAPPEPGLSNSDCVKKIYRECNHDTNFTDQELEKVRQYLNYSFTQLADIKPDKPLCDKILVRQDWKCLTKTQRDRLAEVWRQLYDEGLFHYLADIHYKNWPAWHKTPEFVTSHRWLYNQLEVPMRAIDPDVTIPYSIPWLFGAQAERASIWEYFGTYGNYSNGYCVTDGFYPADLTPCLKREWSPRGTIYPMGTPEFITYLIQNSNSFGALLLNVVGIHFEAHINYGGYPAQFSIRTATYE